MSCTSVHHVEICVQDVHKNLYLFTHKLGFKIIAIRHTSSCQQWVLRQNNSTFVLTKRSQPNNIIETSMQQTRSDQVHSNDLESGQCPRKLSLSDSKPSNQLNSVSKDGIKLSYLNEEWTAFCCSEKNNHTTDSVFNTAIIVSNVYEMTSKVKLNGGSVLKAPTKLTDASGQVVYAIIASGFGNIVHTLIDKRNYTGTFLPGYILSNVTEDEDNKLDTPLSTHIDHIAFVCPEGNSNEIIHWYENVFNMKRFLINRYALIVLLILLSFYILC